MRLPREISTRPTMRRPL